MTSRSLVHATLSFENRGGRVPRHLWTLPWATTRFPDMIARLAREYPEDLASAPSILAEPQHTVGDLYAPGEYVDAWGCRFFNLQAGVHGEIREPISRAEDYSDAWQNARFPREWLSFDRNAVRDFCAHSDKFVLAGISPRPFEQIQFIRGSEQFFLDLALREHGMLRFLGDMHAFYCELMEEWAKTDVDALQFMDDWGAQKSLLISPEMWKELFLPMYRDYINIAHSRGKRVFMHTDGFTLPIFPMLIDAGLDAINAQLFCIGLENLAQFKGKITFWGEMDRQHILPRGTKEEVRAAVRAVRDTLWQDGGCIAQCEFGPGANPENVLEMYRAWDEIV